MGRVWVFGDDVSTDDIIPGRLNITTDPKELAKNLFVYKKEEFKNAEPGDVIIAGKNFGCGSSREHAAIGLKAKGVYLIAESYGWIFYRNCVNIGLLPLQLEKPVEIEDGEEAKVDLENYKLITEKGTYELKKVPDFILEICKSGGLINYLKKHGGYQK